MGAVLEEVINRKNNDEEMQFCGFKIGGGHYVIPVLEVQEVIKSQRLTKVPLAPVYVDGLINLRGQVVTSINLRKLFQIEGEAPDDHMNIIVKSEESLYALVVDEIHDVIDVATSTFEHTPDTLENRLKDFIDGVFKQEGRLLILLNLDKLLNIENK